MSSNKNKKVDITRIEKRGEWYKVEGVVGDKKVSIDIPAPTVERLPDKQARDLMRRSIYGQSQADKEG